MITKNASKVTEIDRLEIQTRAQEFLDKTDYKIIKAKERDIAIPQDLLDKRQRARALIVDKPAITDFE